MEFIDHCPRPESFKEAVLQGLSQPRKAIPPKFFYDQVGSELFEQICELPEYYLTRAELRILEAHVDDLAQEIGPHSVLVEFGSGASRKTQVLLSRLQELRAYVPVEISKSQLLESSRVLENKFPGLNVVAICADFSEEMALPRGLEAQAEKRAVFFPGSTIGNFDPQEASEFLKRSASFLGVGGSLIIGVDLVKDSAILEAAYNDSQGITAKFNLNLLSRMNHELGATFDLRAFRHRAWYDRDLNRIEMHLESVRDQLVHVADRQFHFRAGETIHTENSYKYTPERFEQIAGKAGFTVGKSWMDSDKYFALYLLKVREIIREEEPRIAA